MKRALSIVAAVAMALLDVAVLLACVVVIVLAFGGFFGLI